MLPLPSTRPRAKSCAIIAALDEISGLERESERDVDPGIILGIRQWRGDACAQSDTAA